MSDVLTQTDAPTAPSTARDEEPRAGLQSSARVAHREMLLGLLVALGFLVFSIWLSWPLADDFTHRIGGEDGDPFQTLWSWRCLRDALVTWHNPFFTTQAYYPRGASLVFQTFDIPTALLTLPLWQFLPPIAVYNTGLLFAFWMSAYGMYLLAFELTRDRLAAFCAGVLFTACPYHIAHSIAHMHLASMGWLPIYFLYLSRMLAGRANKTDGLLAGLFLALASLASWYHLLFALVGTLVLLVHTALRSWRTLLSRGFLASAVALAAAYLALAGPLLIAILVAKSKQALGGAHNPHEFSADVYGFFFPNALQAWSESWGHHAAYWTGNAAENGLYLGYSVLACALLAPLFTGTRARVWLSVACVGAVLALGPELHTDGKAHSQSLPYAWLEHVMPQLEFMGCPIRLCYLVYLGLILSWTLTISSWRDLTRARLERKRVTNKRWTERRIEAACALIAIAPLALALVEYLPAPFMTTEALAPPPMLEWGQDAARYAVLDMSGTSKMLWHATIHRKPTVGGYLTRVPADTEGWYGNLPVVVAMQNPEFLSMTTRLQRVDGPIDFAWGHKRPGPGLSNHTYRVEWNGTLLIPRAGEWTFFLSSDDGSRLTVDGSELVGNVGSHPMQMRSGARAFAVGPHSLSLSFTQLGGAAGIRLEWQGPGQTREVVPREAYRTDTGEVGLLGVYRQGSRHCPLDAATAQKDLRALNVRYIVSGVAKVACLQNGFGLTETYRDKKIRIWRMPAAD